MVALQTLPALVARDAEGDAVFGAEFFESVREKTAVSLVFGLDVWWGWYGGGMGVCEESLDGTKRARTMGVVLTRP